MSGEPKTILYVDDDVDDRDMFCDAIRQVAPEIVVALSENGLEALKFLDTRKETHSLPCLIVLDLNMPYLNGRQTLERLKADARLKDIHVVILSSGRNPADKSWFQQAGIAYFTKPVETSIMENIASQLANYCG